MDFNTRLNSEHDAIKKLFFVSNSYIAEMLYTYMCLDETGIWPHMRAWVEVCS